MSDLTKDLKAGGTFYKVDYCGFIGRKEYKCHVLAIFDEYYIAYKWYGIHKQCWMYEIDHRIKINSLIKLHKRWKNELAK